MKGKIRNERIERVSFFDSLSSVQHLRAFATYALLRSAFQKLILHRMLEDVKSLSVLADKFPLF
jgi:hypothetical protein